MPTLHNKNFILVDFEQKRNGQFLKGFANFRANFCSKSAEMKTLFCNVGMGNKLYEVKKNIYVVKEWSF